jgi:hypothetical protein
MIDCFCQALLIHSQVIYMKLFNPLLYIRQQIFIHPVFHIADRDIGPGCLSCLCNLHHQMWVADPAADQSGIEHDRLNESVTGTTE